MDKKLMNSFENFFKVGVVIAYLHICMLIFQPLPSFNHISQALSDCLNNMNAHTCMHVYINNAEETETRILKYFCCAAHETNSLVFL